MLKVNEKNYYLTEIEAECTDYKEAIEYCEKLIERGFIPDFYTGFKENNESQVIYFIKGIKKNHIE